MATSALQNSCLLCCRLHGAIANLDILVELNHCRRRGSCSASLRPLEEIVGLGLYLTRIPSQYVPQLQITVIQCVQTSDGRVPVHYVSEEHQEWLIFRALPRCDEAIRQILAQGGARVRHLHDKVQEEIGWDEGKMKRKYYGIANDRAGVHTYTDWPRMRMIKSRKKRKELDRRDYKRGEEGWMPLARCQSIPQAPRMQDSTESAVEMVIRKIKHHAHEYLDSLPGTEPLTWQDLIEALRRGVEQGATLEHVQKCWDHMTKACRVMCATKDTTLKVEIRGRTRTVQGTDGGWIPRPING